MANVVKYILELEDRASAGLNKGADAADRYDAELKDVDKSQKATQVSATAVAAGVTAFATAAVGAAGSAAALAQNVADLRNDLIDAETRSGIAAETLAGLRLAAEGSGQSFGALTSSLDQFGVRVAAAATGTGRQADAFAALGVSVSNADGSLRDGNAVLEETLAALNAMPPSAERSALAVDTLGRSGGKLLQALSGSELSGFVDLAREFGVGVGPDAAKAAGDWQRQMAELNLVIDGLKARLVDVVGGADGIQSFTDAIVVAGDSLAFFFSNALRPAEEFGSAILGIFGFVERSIGRVGDGLSKLASGDFIGAAKAVGQILEDQIKSAASLVTAGFGLAGGGAGVASDALAAGEARLGELQRARLNTGTGGAGAVDAARQAAQDEALAMLGIPSAGVQVAPDAGDDAPTKAVRSVSKAAAEAVKPLGDWRDAILEIDTSAAIVTDSTANVSADLIGLSTAYAEAGENLERATRQARVAAGVQGAATGTIIGAQAARGNVGGALSGLGGVLGSSTLGAIGAGAGAISSVGAAGVSARQAQVAELRAARASGDAQRIQLAEDSLQSIGQNTANAVGEQIQGFVDGISALFQALPGIIGGVVPKLITGLIGDFVPSLLKAVPGILKALVVDLPFRLVKTLPKAIFDLLKALFVDLPRQIGRQFVRAIANLPRRIGDAIRRALGLETRGSTGTAAQSEANRERAAEIVGAGGLSVGSFQPRTPQEQQAARMAAATPVRSRLDITRPVDVPRRGMGAVGGNPFRQFADMYDSQAGAFGTQPGLAPLTR